MSKLKRVDKLTGDAFELWLEDVGEEGTSSLIMETLDRAVGAGLLLPPGAPIDELTDAEIFELWESFRAIPPARYEEACTVMEGAWLDSLGIEAQFNPYHTNTKRQVMSPERIAELKITQDEALKNEYRRWYLEMLRAGRGEELSGMIASFLRLTIPDVPAHYVSGEDPPPRLQRGPGVLPACPL